jgi:hypothetical protein
MAVSKSGGLRAMQRQVQGWAKYLFLQYWGAFLQSSLQGTTNKYYVFWVCVCRPRYPACNAHASYYICHLWPIWLYRFFPHYLINGTIIEGGHLLSIKCVLDVLPSFCSRHFLILRRIQCDIIRNATRSSYPAPVFLVIFWWNFYFLDRFWKKKPPNFTFYEIPSIGNGFVTCRRTDGRTDRQDEN